MINENNIRESSSSFPKGLEEFRQNIKNKNNSSDIYCHNLYLLQTTDRDGNVTGEAYGMNLMTNWGFKNIYTSTTSYETNCKIYIGNGTDEPVLTNNALYSPIITTGSTNVDTSVDIYPFQYDSSTGIITGVQRIYQGYFDYNISGITEDFEITEIGYGTSTTALVSHARIYDSEGNPSSITKRINERLTINVFWTLNMKESIIQSNYENGVYIVMRPAFSGLLTKTYSRTLYTIYGSQKIGCTESYSNNMYYNVATLLDDNNVKSTIKPNSLLIENQRKYISDIIATDQRKGDKISSTPSSYIENITGEFYFMIMTKDKLTTPEEITTYEAYTDSPTSNTFNNLFGLTYDRYTGKGELPCTNFNITSLSMYNHITKEWDIEESYINDPNTEYDNTWRSFVRVYTTFNGVNCPVWVYVNTRTDLPITSFNNSNIVLYATDKYWDTSTWELISNLSSVDETLQYKRYYIRITDTTDSAKYILYPQREMIYHQISNIRDSYTITSITPKQCYDYINAKNIKPEVNCIVINLSSDKYSWILFGDKLIYPYIENQPIYTLTNKDGYGIDQYCQWTTEDLIIISFPTARNLMFRIYDVSNPDSEPSYNDIILSYSGISSSYPHLGVNTIHRTFTDVGSGFLVCQRYNSETYNECVIVNLHGIDGIPTQTLLTSVQHCSVIGLTSNCVYLNISDNKYVFEVYDMETNNVIYSFKLSAISYNNTDNTVLGIVGWKNLIYIQVDVNGTKVTYLHNITTSKTEQLIENLPQVKTTDTYTGSYGAYYYQNNVRIAYADTCMVLTNFSYSDKNYVIKYDEPEKPIALNFDNNRNRVLDVRLKYVNNNKQLVCLLTIQSQGTNSDKDFNPFIFDMNLFLDKGVFNNNYLRYNISLLYYGNYWYKGYNSAAIFDDGFICGNYNTGPDGSGVRAESPITWSDISCVLPHKMTGTTTTIQSWNNPKRLQNKEYSFTLTNDTTNWGDDTNV